MANSNVRRIKQRALFVELHFFSGVLFVQINHFHLLIFELRQVFQMMATRVVFRHLLRIQVILTIRMILHSSNTTMLWLNLVNFTRIKFFLVFPNIFNTFSSIPKFRCRSNKARYSNQYRKYYIESQHIVFE